jgi:hypothetical protein
MRMKAKPTRWGTGDTEVSLSLDPDDNAPIEIVRSEAVFYVGEAKQLIANLQAAVDTYEEEHGQDTDD